MPTPPFTVAEIRKSFLDFFAAKGHTVVASRGEVFMSMGKSPERMGQVARVII